MLATFIARRSAVGSPVSAGSVVAAVMLQLMVQSPAAGQSARVKNIQLCNGADVILSEPRIKGCTALIDSGKEPPGILAVAYNNRGNAYVRMRDLERAIRDYEQALKIDVGYAKAFNNRGVAYGEAGHHDRAIRDFDEAIRLDTNYANAFANRAKARLYKGEPDRAVLDYDVAIRLRPTLAAWNGRCQARLMQGEVGVALADCDEAVRQDPNDTAALEMRGLVQLRLNQWDLAIRDFNLALKMTPNLARSLYGRGVARRAKGLVEQGDADIAAARLIQSDILEVVAQFGVR